MIPIDWHRAKSLVPFGLEGLGPGNLLIFVILLLRRSVHLRMRLLRRSVHIAFLDSFDAFDLRDDGRSVELASVGAPGLLPQTDVLADDCDGEIIHLRILIVVTLVELPSPLLSIFLAKRRVLRTRSLAETKRRRAVNGTAAFVNALVVGHIVHVAECLNGRSCHADSNTTLHLSRIPSLLVEHSLGLNGFTFSLIGTLLLDGRCRQIDQQVLLELGRNGTRLPTLDETAFVEELRMVSLACTAFFTRCAPTSRVASSVWQVN